MVVFSAVCAGVSPTSMLFLPLTSGWRASRTPDLLEWAATEDRILLTHDVNTIPGFAYERVRLGLPMPGVFLIPKSIPIGQAIDDLELAIKAQTPHDIKDQVLYFPL